MTTGAGPATPTRALAAKFYSFDRRLALLALGMFAIGTDSFVIAGILGEIARDFDVSIAAAGQLITTYALSYAIFTPITAVAMANWPRQRVLLAGILIFVVGNLVAGFGASFALVLIGRCISGLGAAIFAVSTSGRLFASSQPGCAMVVGSSSFFLPVVIVKPESIGVEEKSMIRGRYDSTAAAPRMGAAGEGCRVLFALARGALQD
jgi:hypothetical protein